MNAYNRVLLSRKAGRPTASFYIEHLFDEFYEMHGDRRFSDDSAVIAGLGSFHGNPVTVIGLEKGKDVTEKVQRNFGSAHPEGYRKALRQMRLAEKFGRPVVCLIDTAGAYCGVGAEERGQGQAIAENLYELSTLKTPVVAIFIGEGGSGGALALAVSDEVWVLENATYAVISPEGCASILWKDQKYAPDAAECLKMTAEDLLHLGVADRIFSEAEGFEAVCEELKKSLNDFFHRTVSYPSDELIARRYEKFRKIGRLK